MDHPRWGLIQSVVTNRYIKAGEELYGYYGYKPSEFPTDHPWYFELERQIEKERRIRSRKKGDNDSK